MSTTRRAFTLIELLIVIGIISLLLNLSFPAIRQSREAARRTQCQNNLRQIGLAAHAFVSNRGFFPTAGGNAEDFNTLPTKEGFERAGWGFQLLPFLERRALYDAGHRVNVWDRVPELGKSVAEIPVSVYTCPGRRTRFLKPDENAFTYALGDYAGVVAFWLGEQWKNTVLPTDEEYAEVWRGVLVMGAHFHHVASDGVVYTPYSPIRPADVTDGLSNTILVMEKAADSRNYRSWTKADWWESVGWIHNASWATMRLSFWPLASDDEPRGGKGEEFGFGSPHPGILNALFADGSVKALSLAIDNSYDYDDPDKNAGVLWKLGVRNDGSPTNADQ